MRRAAIQLVVVAVVLAGLWTAGSSSPVTGAQDATPGATAGGACPTTTAAENVALVRRLFAEVLNGRQLDRVPEFYAAAHVHHRSVGPDERGVEARRASHEAWYVAFPDLRRDLAPVFAEGDLVAARWTASGTHQGEHLGIAPTARSAAWPSNAIFRIACGKIAESWVVTDNVGWMRQVGALPDPGSAAPGTPPAPAAAASPTSGEADTAANEALVRRYLEIVLGQGDVEAVEELLHEDHVHHEGIGSDRQQGHDERKERLRQGRTRFPDRRIAIEEVVAEGNLVALRLAMQGTHQGEFLGVAPTGRLLSWTGIAIFRVDNGRIAETWIEVDNLERLRQLDALPQGTPTP